MPPSAASLRARGRDHVRELAGRAVRELCGAGLPARESRLLRRRGRVRDSAGLSVGERRANLAGTFVLGRDGVPREGVLVLVDDVVTSGATLTEAAAVLAAGRPRAGPGTRAGAGSEDRLPVLAAVVAATPRRPPDRLSRPPEGD
jgi:predicted amidophosphoribosyltransferase